MSRKPRPSVPGRRDSITGGDRSIDRRFLTRRQVATRYGVSLRTIARWMADPKSTLPRPYDIEGRPLFDLHEIEAFEPSRRRVGAAIRPEMECSRTTRRPSPIRNGIKEAIDALWPGGVPTTLRAEDRDRQIEVWLKESGCSVSNSREALRRALQRELKARRQL
jgi:predicted DNA-binding transcriptional regulator AlpA